MVPGHSVRRCQVEPPRVHCHVFTWYLVTVYGAVRLSLHGFIVTCLHGTWSQCTALSSWAATGLLSRVYMVPGHSVRRCQVEPPRVLVTCLHGTWSQCTALSGWASTGSLSRVYMVPGHSVRRCQVEPPRVHCHVFTWYLVTVYGAVRLSLHGFLSRVYMVPGHSVRRCQVEPPRVHCHVFTWYLVTVYGAVRLSLHGFIVTCLHGTWSQCTALSGWASTGLLSRVYMVPGHSVRRC